MDARRLLASFKPSRRQLFGSLGISLAILLATYGGVLLDRLLRGSLFTDSYVKQISFQQLTKLSDIKAVGLLVQVLFWGGVGLVAYVIYLGVTNTLTEARNEIVIETSYTNKGDLNSRLGKLAVQVGLGLAVFAAFAGSALLLLPVWLGQFENFLTNLPAAGSFVALLTAVLGLALNSLVVLMLTRAALAVE